MSDRVHRGDVSGAGWSAVAHGAASEAGLTGRDTRFQPRSLRIALVGEGAYPVGPGGVSLWCHQLIQGMPEHQFTAVALTVTGHEPTTWTAPSNLVSVVKIPLWGLARGRHPRLHQASHEFVEAHRDFLTTLFEWMPGQRSPAPSPSPFEAALRAMTEHAREGDVSRELMTEASVERLIASWRTAARRGQLPRGVGQLSVRDALAANARLEHLLRPLSHPPLDVDICHLSMAGVSALVALRSRWAYGTPTVLSEHGVYLRERLLAMVDDPETEPVKLITARFHRAMTATVYQFAESLAPHSAFNRRWQVYGGGSENRMRTMYNGIDPLEFPQASDEPEFPTIVFVGRIDPLKDLHTLIRAFAIVRGELPDARLRMFGPVAEDTRAYHRSCLELIDRLGLDGAATFEGRIEKTVHAYEAGHLVALTSVSEGFPFTVVESMSTGRPQVATDVGGVSEAVGDAGFVVPARDHEAVAAACLTLLRDPELRRAMAARARQRVLEEFTLIRWTHAYRDIYCDLARALGERHSSESGDPVERDPDSDFGGGRVIDLTDAAQAVRLPRPSSAAPSEESSPGVAV